MVAWCRDGPRQGHPHRRRRQKHADGVAYCHMEVLVAHVALDRHPGDTCVVLGYLVKAGHLRHLTLRSDQLLLDGRKGDKKMLQLKT